MGTTVEKGAYLTETKSQLKEAINNIGGSITSETTFREYAQELDNIYDNIPKTTGEGSSLSLNTLKGKMDIIPKSDTSQTQYNGYQMLDLKNGTYTNNGITAVVSNGEITLNGTSSSTTTAFVTIPVNTNYEMVANQTYTTSMNNPVACANGVVRFRVQTNGTKDTSLANVNATYTFTYDTGDTYTTNVQIRIEKGNTLTNFFFKPMLEKSSTAHTWEPYARKFCKS